MKSRNYIFNSSTQHFPWILPVFFFVCAQLISCRNSGHQSAQLARHYSDATFAKAKRAKNPEEARIAIQYIDSVYASFPYVSIADLCRYYYFMAQVNLDSNDHNKSRSLLYVDSILGIIENHNLTEALEPDYTRALLMKGGYLLENSRFAEAYRYYSRGLSFAHQYGNSCAAGAFEGVLGSLFFKQGQFSQAVVHYRQSYRTSLMCSDSNTLFVQTIGNRSNLALSFLRMRRIDSALFHFYGTMDFIFSNQELRARNDKYADQALGVLYGNMAQAYMQSGNYEAAEKWFSESICVNDREGYEVNDATATMLHLADMYLVQNRIRAADSLLQKTWSRTGKESYLRLLWLKVHGHYAQLQHPASALDEQVAYYRFKDSISELQKPFLNSSFIQAFADEARNQQIQLIRKDNELRRLMLLIAVVVSILLALIAAIIFINLRKTRRLMREMGQLSTELVARKEQKRKEDLFLQEMELQLDNQNNLIAQRKKISDDMHDDLSSSLIALKFFVDDARKRADSDLSRTLLNSIAGELEVVYEEARDYIHNLRAQALQQEYNLTQYLVDIGRKFEAHTSLRIFTDIDDVSLRHTLDTTQNEHLYHIVKEGLSNVIKHSGGSLVRISIGFEDGYCIFSITDNGQGLDSAACAAKGQGLASIRYRMLQLDGCFDIDSGPEGTVLSGKFPVREL
jgi:signal transduction histidine kinase